MREILLIFSILIFLYLHAYMQDYSCSATHPTSALAPPIGIEFSLTHQPSGNQYSFFIQPNIIVPTGISINQSIPFGINCPNDGNGSTNISQNNLNASFTLSGYNNNSNRNTTLDFSDCTISIGTIQTNLGNYSANDCSFSDALLPIELINFRGRALADNQVKLSWVTAFEEDNMGFQLQRGGEDLNFEDIAWISGNGHSSRTLIYHYTDSNPSPGINYYRLKQLDWDESASYSDIIQVEIEEESPLNIYPNPVGDQLFFNTALQEPDYFLVLNIQGRILSKEQPSNNYIETSGLNPGMYLLEYYANDRVLRQRFMKK